MAASSGTVSIGDIEQPAIDRVEAVGDVGEQQRRVMLEQRAEGVRQHLVRAVADEDLFGPHLVVVGQRRPQRGGLRVRIEAQRVGRLGADRFQRARGRTKRAFIGVELDQLRHAGLFARHIGLQVVRQAGSRNGSLLCPDITVAALRRAPH